MIDAILNLLFPLACVICGSPVLERRWGAACPSCWAKVTPVQPPFCIQCGVPAPAIETRCGACRRGEHVFDFCRSALHFNDTLREIIHHFKYSERVSLARPLGEWMKACLERESFQGDVVLPVPLHRSRERHRGFNQAELLSRSLGRKIERRLIRRRKNTPTQTGLSKAQRAANLAGAFEVSGRVPECVIVTDDVYTTGSTVNEISRTLKRAGALRVEVLTLARVQRPGLE